MKQLPIFFFCLIFAMQTSAQTTYSEHIAPIIYENCTSCHRPGEIAPMSFTNYDEVAARAQTIEHVTQSKFMPPWPPETSYSHFLNERALTEDQIALISDWVQNGFPQGDPSLEPDLPIFSTGSQVGTPDLVLKMEEPHTIVGNNLDDYQVFVIPTDFGEDRELASIEFRPDNNKVVHHVLFGYDLSGKAQLRDDATPEYGYATYGDFGIDEAVFLSWTYVPGSIPLVYPEGIGEILPDGADLLVQVHYAPFPVEETDQSEINIFFKSDSDPIVRKVITGITLPDNLPGGFNSFFIPPNTVKEFTAFSVIADINGSQFNINQDISLISVFPHAHLLGQEYEIFVVTPTGDTINLIHVPKYDFNWQGSYAFDRMKKIPANSTWVTRAVYDNTVDNPLNPNNPPRTVRWGDSTTDEMFVNFFHYIPYNEGDEDIDLGNTTSTFETEIDLETSIFQINPNPSAGKFNISFESKTSENIFFELFDLNGRFLKTLSNRNQYPAGDHVIKVDASEFPTGNYLVRMNDGNSQGTMKLSIVK